MVTHPVPMFVVGFVDGNVSIWLQPVQILLGCVSIEGHFTATIVAMTVVVVQVVGMVMVIVLCAIIVVLFS